MNKILNYIKGLPSVVQDKDFLIILGCLSAAVLLVIVLIIIIKKKVKSKNTMDNENDKGIPVQGETNAYNGVNYSESQSYNMFNNQNTTVDTSQDKKAEKENKKQEKKKKAKKEKPIDIEKNKCIELYNQLYSIYLNYGYPVDMQNNNVLAYYSSWFMNNCSSIEDYQSYQCNIQIQIQNVLNESNNAQSNSNPNETKEYYRKESEKYMVELENIFNIVGVNGKSTINDLNFRLLNQTGFSTVDDYKCLYEEILQNIEYLKSRYKEVLEKKRGSSTEVVNYKLMDALQILECNASETDLKVIKDNYLRLIKKYHPDRNSDSEKSLDMSSKINIAYSYAKEIFDKSTP